MAWYRGTWATEVPGARPASAPSKVTGSRQLAGSSVGIAASLVGCRHACMRSMRRCRRHHTAVGSAALPAGRPSSPITGSSSELVLPGSRLPNATLGCTLGNCTSRRAGQGAEGNQVTAARLSTSTEHEPVLARLGWLPTPSASACCHRLSAAAAAAAAVLKAEAKTGQQPSAQRTSFSTGSSSSLDRKQRSVECRSMASLQGGRTPASNNKTGSGGAQQGQSAGAHPDPGSSSRSRRCSSASAAVHAAHTEQARRGQLEGAKLIPNLVAAAAAAAAAAAGKRAAHWMRWMRLEDAENSSSFPWAPR